LFEVKKYAFDSEIEARDAFGNWSYVRILTCRNREISVYGTIFAPTVGKIREAIDDNRPTASAAQSRVKMAAKGSEAPINEYTVYSTNRESSTGSLADETTEWAVWVDQMFEVRRYGFATEAAAREAMDNWYCVRILTRGEEEVTARSRWHSEALLSIRETIKANKDFLRE